MKKRMYDDQKVILSSCLDFIEEAISRGDSYSEITCGVQILFHSNYGTLRNMFSTYTPFPSIENSELIYVASSARRTFSLN